MAEADVAACPGRQSSSAGPPAQLGRPVVGRPRGCGTSIRSLCNQSDSCRVGPVRPLTGQFGDRGGEGSVGGSESSPHPSAKASGKASPRPSATLSDARPLRTSPAPPPRPVRPAGGGGVAAVGECGSRGAAPSSSPSLRAWRRGSAPVGAVAGRVATVNPVVSGRPATTRRPRPALISVEVRRVGLCQPRTPQLSALPMILPATALPRTLCRCSQQTTPTLDHAVRLVW